MLKSLLKITGRKVTWVAEGGIVHFGITFTFLGAYTDVVDCAPGILMVIY